MRINWQDVGDRTLTASLVFGLFGVFIWACRMDDAEDRARIGEQLAQCEDDHYEACAIVIQDDEATKAEKARAMVRLASIKR